MEEFLPIIKIVLGFVLLAAGAELLVRGAEQFSKKLGVSALFVGICLVSFGTAAPELVILLLSLEAGQPEIGIGNIIGSNISNVLFVMALGALISPIAVRSISVARDGVVLIAACGVLIWTADALALQARDGYFFVGAVLLYLFYVFATEKLRAEELGEPLPLETLEERESQFVSNPALSFILMIVGIVAGGFLLYLGAREIINGAGFIAQQFEIDNKIVALSFVALGSSLPEVAATIVAAVRKQTELIVGNLLGSSIINIFGVIGVAAILAPGVTTTGVPIAEYFTIDILIMFIATLLLIPFMVTGKEVNRVEAVILLALYGGYLFFLFNFHGDFADFELPI